ncbi:putative histone acetyltransferase type B subunit [Clavispora lusitaniae]|uniref:Histone-binding protein RBBP4-like N-terminal domain-containing protein n=2 Tax=Clavispora lusitaniae TaxID=36911 RepID=C4YBV4_CLAL4|nr:uncharacterized protein CLUG_05682 [Clavispora lusitaniae ATCC 42720]KAF5208543.1 Histone acetyltransferase type B subunit 2 [Clavispora lusitaniae]EEQ41554.1 hypothetical protein CLUG_05682 [Clavispora lusitaniae ATCC 42720]KAF7580643.1 Histone acetyltransferase type B subunit 2 domain protein [Clavispora lusitaniae]QFZ30527.1 putative histone acetyltransferase type B subunit [Clavispora lusitaniae]QFZ36189.1 putative histone acetyltransferase type B subunit [Clavispora lusitaniae]
MGPTRSRAPKRTRFFSNFVRIRYTYPGTMAEDQSVNIKDEYELWRKNCRYMYEFVSETALTWPSLTVEWLPDHKIGDVIDAQLLLGTHTSGEDTNYLKLASTQLPRSGVQRNEGTPAPKVSSKIKIMKKFENTSEINRARYMPQDANIVATINGSGELDFADLNAGKSIAHVSPHTENGYGLSWNASRKGYLLSSSDDKSVVLTDFNTLDKNDGRVFRSEVHTDIVNDVKWHAFDENVFGSVSDDEKMLLFDTRSPEKAVSCYSSVGSKGINSLAFSPFSKNLLAIGDTNSNINLLDLRKLSSISKGGEALHTMMGHGDAITCLEFSPHKDGIIASGSQDRRVIIWDLSKIGEEQVQEDAEDGCPEIFMMHAGHTGAVTDLSWCPFVDWTLASVADDNIVHLWEISKSLVEDAPAVVNDADLE